MKGPCRPILSVGLDPLTPLSLGGGRSSRPDSLSLSLGPHLLDSLSLGPHPLTLLVFTPWTPSLLVLTPSPPHPLSLLGVSWSPPPLPLPPSPFVVRGPHPLTLLVFTPWTPSLLVLTPSPPHPLSLGGVRASPPDPLSLRERGDSGLGSGWVRDGVQALGGRRSARRVGGNSRRAHGSLANLVRGCRWSPRRRGSVASAPYNAAKAPFRPVP